MNFTEGIKEIHAIIAERSRPHEDILSAQQELSRLIKQLERVRKQYEADMKEFLTGTDYFNFELWEKKNRSRDLWLDAANAISSLKTAR